MRKQKISFLGELLIIIIIVLFVYLFLNQTKQTQINQIDLINQKYGISNQILMPGDHAGYISEISNVSEEITDDLINFVKLNQEISEIERMVFRASVVREDCASRELKLKINSINQNIDKLTRDFEEKNIKKYQKLNIPSYVKYLKTIKSKYFLYKTDIDKLATC